MRAWIGLGSNLQGPSQQVRRGLQALAALPRSTLGPVSSLYRSAPIGGIDQPDFCNAVAALDTALSPPALLRAVQAIETAAGRLRTARWGPRVLDLDLLLYEDLVMDSPALVLPHPRMHERAFVLVPLVEVAPELEIPGRGPATALRNAAHDPRVVPWHGP